MNSRFEKLYIQFHSHANEIFQEAGRNFQLAAGNINRESEEFRFQQAKMEHVRSLAKKLEDAATALLAGIDSIKDTAEAGQTLQLFIKDYLHRFVQKINNN